MPNKVIKVFNKPNTFARLHCKEADDQFKKEIGYEGKLMLVESDELVEVILLDTSILGPVPDSVTRAAEKTADAAITKFSAKDGYLYYHGEVGTLLFGRYLEEPGDCQLCIYKGVLNYVDEKINPTS